MTQAQRATELAAKKENTVYNAEQNAAYIASIAFFASDALLGKLDGGNIENSRQLLEYAANAFLKIKNLADSTVEELTTIF